MNNRLQFRHHGNGSGYTAIDGVFETREDAINYIIHEVKNADDGLAAKDPSHGFSLYAEPTILRYKNLEDEENPHVIMVIGAMTNESGRCSKNKFCIIDIGVWITQNMEKIVTRLTVNRSTTA